MTVRYRFSMQPVSDGSCSNWEKVPHIERPDNWRKALCGDRSLGQQVEPPFDRSKTQKQRACRTCVKRAEALGIL